MESGDLIAERFSASRGHEDKGVLALDEARDNFLLLGPIGFVAEDILKTLQWVTGHEYKSQFLQSKMQPSQLTLSVLILAKTETGNSFS
jgi:uncharacterized protein Smg (DUF494 family)